jgi:dTDP-4-dehydrorhamnose reductase
VRILLFGKNGQVGWELQRSLSPLGELVALGSADADFRSPEALSNIVEQARPELVVNAAAFTAVDKAEADHEAAHLVNSVSPGVLARAVRARGALLVHYSTDYVFDGSGDAPRDEDAPTGPLNVYGATKLEGEQRIAFEGVRALVFRTSWVYATRGGNFAKTMLRLAGERERLTVVADQVGAPTGADLIADVTVHAVRAALADPASCGLYHLAATGEASWHGYARFVLEQAEALTVPLKAGPAQVEPVPSSAYPVPARRPLNSRLDTRRLQAKFGLTLPDWRTGVARMLRETLRA